MTEQSIFALIGSLGFPIVVTIYLLHYFRKTIDSLKDVIAQNSLVMTRLCERLGINPNDKINL